MVGVFPLWKARKIGSGSRLQPTKDTTMLHVHTHEAQPSTTHADAPDQRTRRIRELNDDFRMWRGRGPFLGKMVQTIGISSKPQDDKSAIMAQVFNFNTFTNANDPNGEHDFGAFDFKGEKIFWKIDYYDQNLDMGSRDPSDPAKCVRVLTVMLATEY